MRNSLSKKSLFIMFSIRRCEYGAVVTIYVLNIGISFLRWMCQISVRDELTLSRPTAAADAASGSMGRP